jgi:hypothetical protein
MAAIPVGRAFAVTLSAMAIKSTLTPILYLESGYGAGTFGNIILGGVIGWGIDSATGADNKYPTSANVQFIPLGATPAAPQPQTGSVSKPVS